MENNIILLTDSYKQTHWNQLPPKTKYMYSYMESRTGAEFPTTCFFGLQYILQKYLVGKVVTKEKIHEAYSILGKHFDNNSYFNFKGWEYILDKHNGRLPISIKAVREGTNIPTNNVMMTIQNTDPNCPWLCGFIDSLLMHVWYASTVATKSREMKKLLLKYCKNTGGNIYGISNRLVDFGFRGSSSVESAGIGGCAHLLNFTSTDNLPALMVANQYYYNNNAGHSIPASEHSTMTCWGKNNEKQAYSNMLDKYPTGLIAVVSDSYDINNAILNIWKSLKNKVIHRDGLLLIRPDSGELPLALLEVLNMVGQIFGFTMNSKGFKVLNPKIRVIQGDGIDLDSLELCLKYIQNANWCTDNTIFGSGGALLQKMNRDTQKFAIKCSAAYINNKWIDVFKSPANDTTKKSKKGRLKLIMENNKYKTVKIDNPKKDLMVEVFRDGRLLYNQFLSQIIENNKL